MSFQKRLSAQEFVVLAEMHTPKGVNITRLVNDARRIKGRIDGVVIPDMDNGIMRMSALAGGVLMQQQGIEAIMHVYCRDRNRMALQGDVLAAHVMGIQNLLVTGSEDMSQSDHRDAAEVYDIDEVELVGAITGLTRGKDMGGFELDGVPSFTTGISFGPFSDDASFEEELQAASRKVEAGARFMISPPVFDLEKFRTFMDKVAPLSVPVIPTVFLIKSLAIAQYIANSEPEAAISDDLIRRIRKSSDREHEGIKIAAEMLTAVKSMAQGVMLQTLGWENRIPDILDTAGM